MIDAYETTRHRYIIVLEIAPSTLRGMIRTRPVRVRRMNTTPLQQLANGIRQMHALNVAHRDLKPDNVLAWSMGNANVHIKICDFGFAAPCDGRLTTICGTPSYMAPELFLYKQYDGKAVDVWAFGCILIEYMNDTIAFTAFNAQILRHKILKRKVTKTALRLPPAWSNVCKACFHPCTRRISHDDLAKQVHIAWKAHQESPKSRL